MLEVIGFVVGAVITIVIFSYLVGDNLIYRWGLALLVGSGVGYALGIVLRFVFFEWVAQALGGATSLGQRIYYAIPLFLGVLLLLKGFPRIAHLGNVSMGVMLGIGAAVALSGALLGTLVPQIEAVGTAVTSQGFIWGGITVVGTVCSLLVFSTAPKEGGRWQRLVISRLQSLGEIFIAIALAMAFAGAVTSALTVMVDRLWSIADLLLNQIDVIVGG